MRRNSGSSFTISGAYTSPGTPEYGDYTYSGLPKGWCSERVPLPTYSSRRHVSSTALMPFNSGRTLPSKWDDAERWITSPLSGFGSFKNSVAQPQRRPKSKSGPLGPSGLDYLPGYSPTTPVKEGGIVMGGFMANSPLTTGVLVPDGLSVHYENGAGAESSSLFDNINMTRSVSVPGLSNLLSESCVPISQDEKLYGATEEAAYVSRRDMATQMSPEGSTNSSSKGRLSFSTLPSSISTSVCLHRNPAGKDDIRDVQVDKGTTTARGSKNQGLKKMESTSVENMSSSWDVSKASKSISKLREEAKITAWENLQKAKAEAAILKLEMKLEKKRSASMDKITNKLRASQMKAEVMRHTVREQSHTRAHKSRPVYLRICSVFNCFFCLN